MIEASESEGRDGQPVTRITFGNAPRDPLPDPIRVVGGTSRIQYAREEERIGGEPQANRVVGGTLRHAPRTGEAGAVEVAHHNVSAPVEGGDILTTACRAWGAPITADRMDSRSTVEWRGMRMGVEIAIRDGAPIERDPNGGYRMKGAASPSPAPASAPDQSGDMEQLGDEYGLGDGEVQAHATVAKSVSAPILEGFVAQAMQMAAKDGDLSALFDTATGGALRRGGHDAHALQVMQGMKREADRVITKLGADPADVFSWAQINAPQTLTAAMVEHYNTGDARAYRSLVSQFRRGRNV